MVAVNYLHKFYVDAARKLRVGFETCAYVGNVDGFGVVDKEHKMRIAHIDGRGGEFLSKCCYGVALDSAVGKVEEFAFAHIHVNGVYLVGVVNVKVEGLDARKCVETDYFFVGQAFVVEVFAYAARGVAAHFGF